MHNSTQSATILVISAALTAVIWLLAAQHPVEVVMTAATDGNIIADKVKYNNDRASKWNQRGQRTVRYNTAEPQEKAIADKAKYHRDLVTKVNQIGQWTARYNTAGPREPRCGGFESRSLNFRSPTRASSDEGMRSHFDARNKWPHCALLQQPAMNQGSCGSCWAVSTTSAIADRICIATKGRQQPQLSVLDVLCTFARTGGVEARRVCAHGGSQARAYAIWNMIGIVTGGIYGSADSCKPYPFSGSCGSPCPMSSKPVELQCSAECQPLYSKAYSDDKYYGKNTTVLPAVAPDTQAREPINPIPLVQRTLIDSGPVTGFMDVFEDFLHYGSGVYQYAEGNYCYSHFVKIIGWGRENDVDYWIVANSWGETWGEAGFGKVAMDHVIEYAFADAQL